MKRPTALLPLLLALAACPRDGARSEKSFTQIQGMLAGKTAAQVESMLGPPDTRQPTLLNSERWIWWNYTFLDGNDFAPERRGQVVHLEIGFDPPAGKRAPYDQWKISELLGVTYAIPRNVPERRSREEP